MKFKYKFSKVFIVLFIIMYALAVGCFAWNLVRLFQSLNSQIEMSPYSYISIMLCLVLPIVVCIFITTIILSSYYKIDQKHLTVKLGILTDKYDLAEIDNVVKNLKLGAVAINFKDESMLKITIDEKLFDDFCAELLKANKGINYGETDEIDKNKGKNA